MGKEIYVRPDASSNDGSSPSNTNHNSNDNHNLNRGNHNHHTSTSRLTNVCLWEHVHDPLQHHASSLDPPIVRTNEVVVIARLEDKRNCPETTQSRHYGLVMRYTLLHLIYDGYASGIFQVKPGQPLFVAHGAPELPRPFYIKHFSGSLRGFEEGAVHRLRLKEKISENASPFDVLVDPYLPDADTEQKEERDQSDAQRYLCIRADLVALESDDDNDEDIDEDDDEEDLYGGDGEGDEEEEEGEEEEESMLEEEVLQAFAEEREAMRQHQHHGSGGEEEDDDDDDVMSQR